MKKKHIAIPTAILIPFLLAAGWRLWDDWWRLEERVTLHQWLLEWHGLDKP